MPHLKVRELAQAQDLNMSQLQLRAGVAMGTVRRYWYGTKNGKESGQPLTEVDLDILSRIAKVLDARLVDLIEEADWLALRLAATQHNTSRRAGSEAAGIALTSPALHP